MSGRALGSCRELTQRPRSTPGIAGEGLYCYRKPSELSKKILVGVHAQGIKSNGLGIWGVYAKFIRLDDRDDQVLEVVPVAVLDLTFLQRGTA